MSERTILVTGSSGLLGHAVLGRIARCYRGIGLDSVATADAIAGVVTAEADLRDAGRLIELVRAHAVTDIVHAGGISHPLLLADQPATVFAINVHGTENVLEAARLGGVERLVFVSSAAVYGAASPTALVDENAPLRPDSMYGASKAAAEMLVSGYHAYFGMETVILRPVSIYGSRRQTFSVASYLIANALDGLPSRIRGAAQALDLIHVDDVARAVALALDSTTGVGGTYTIASGSPITYAQIAGAVRRLLPDSQIEVERGPGEPGSEGRYLVAAAERDLGFRAELTLEAGLSDMVEVLRRRADLRERARAAQALVAPTV